MSIFATFLERYKHYELLIEKFYFTISDKPVEPNKSEIAFSISDYPNEFSFKQNSPPSIRHIYSFFDIVHRLLESGKAVHFYTKTSNLAHSIILICSFIMIRTKQGADLVFAPFSLLSAMIHPFRFTDSNQKIYDLTAVTCLRSFERSLKCNLFSIQSFNPEQYEYFKALSMGWIVPDFLLAFSSNKNKTYPLKKVLLGFNKLHLNHYISLSGSIYDRQTFLDYGFDLTEYDVSDDSNPPLKILKSILEILETSDHTFVIHSHGETDKSGLFCACLLIRKYKFSPDEAIAWVKMCKPESISNSQLFFISDFDNLIKKSTLSVEIAPPDPKVSRRLAPRNRVRSNLGPVNSSPIQIQIKTPQSMSVRKFDSPITEPPNILISKQPICPSAPCIKARAPPRKMHHFISTVPEATLA